MSEVTKSTRQTYFKEFDTHFGSDHQFVEVTEWTNGEGIDINFHREHFRLTWNEYEAMNDVVEKLLDGTI